MSKKINKLHNPTRKNVVEIIKHHPNGKVSQKTPYVNGKQHGPETSWYENGTKKSITMWRDGWLYGVEVGWHESGSINWRDGKKNGVNAAWYENGTKMWEETCGNEKRHGMSTCWNENGAKAMETHYQYGIEYARIKWDEEGAVSEVNLPVPRLRPGIKDGFNSKKNHIEGMNE